MWLADGSQTGVIILQAPAYWRLELADRILDVQLRVPVVVPQNVAGRFLYVRNLTNVIHVG